MRIRMLMCLLLLASFAAAQDSRPAEMKKTPGFDINALDRSVEPCEDFYEFACGGWRKNNPVPGDQPSWGRFNELFENNRNIMRDILEKASANDAKRNAVDQKIGDYYASCLDEAAINKKGLAPLDKELKLIAGMKDKKELAKVLAHLQSIGVNAGFDFGSQADPKDASQIIAYIDQGGMGLPERDYYLRDDEKSKDTRAKYVAHIQKMLELSGEKPEAAAAQAKTIMEMETALAQASLDVVSRREPKNLDNPATPAQLAAMSPLFDWTRFLAGTGLKSARGHFNVREPKFVKEGLQSQIAARSLDDWKAYLKWRTLTNSAPMLPTQFVDENFNFFSKELNGIQKLQDRWKRCVANTDARLGEALGQAFVERTFGEEGKKRMQAMVDNLYKALAADIDSLEWMSAETKKRAHEKLSHMRNKIGYPEKWRDYSSYKVVRGDALGNVQRGNAFEFNRQLAKIGKPVDKDEWQMSPPTVNAYYEPTLNDINFPAGILQPPFFDLQLDDAVNYGAIGAVIGHELTHGFDDEGRKYDAYGNLKNWWTDEDNAKFEQRAKCISDQYSEYVAVDDVKLNGKLTLGEDTADNGGTRIAYMALLESLKGKDAPKIDGFTPEQRFFLGWGQIWCQNVTPEFSRLLAQVDPHSPGEYRVNGVVSNSPEFAKAFGCKQGQKMVRANACRVW